MIRRSIPSLALATCVAYAPCLAQQATLAITHNDPDGFVLPGETVEVSAIISWSGTSAFWEIQGGVRASPNLGIASNSQFPYTIPPNPSTVTNPGSPSLGSIQGTHIFHGNGNWLLFGTQFPPMPPFGNNIGITLVRFDWTAPATPRTVQFNWEPSATTPDAIMVVSLLIVPVPTTYLGTSLTVVPAPHAAPVLLAGVCAMTATRRRG